MGDVVDNLSEKLAEDEDLVEAMKVRPLPY